jgi:hypothetical protein
MQKEFVKYGFLTIITILIFVFVYPTLYRYDKLDQKLPVRINRITGSAEILYTNGWTTATSTPIPTDKPISTSAPTPTPSSDPITFNGETFKQFYNRAVSELNKGQSIPDENHLFLEWRKAALGLGKLVEPKDYFTIGSTEEDVKKVMGAPTELRQVYDNIDVWLYNLSEITFTNKKISNYRNTSDNLKIR